MISDMVLHKSVSFGLLKEIVAQCSAFGSDITFIKGDRRANAKNIMNLVTLSLHPQDKVAIIVKGKDAREARDRILELLH